MIKIVRYIIIIFSLLCFTCKKRTDIRVRVFNPALNEYVANATVVLIERKGVGSGGIFTSNTSCNEIATAVSDINGYCTFDRKKLKTAAKYFYFCSIKESWGEQQFYTCAGRTSGFLEIGEAQDIIVTDDAEGYLRVQFNNLLNPSQPNDSLIVSLSTIEYPNSKGGVVQGGGGVFVAFPNHNINNPPNYPSVYILDPIKTKGQRLKRYIRKRKLGIMTVSIDTIKVYPNQTTTVQINW